MASLTNTVQLFLKQRQLLSAKLLVAYSGGVDSHVLLHVLAELREQNPGLNLKAIYVHHGLQAEADQWQQHCQKTCADLQVEFQSLTVNVTVSVGESLEAQARAARYAAFKDVLQEGECLCVAQHQDDQAETLLLQLFRGAGLKGLAAMPEQAQFANGQLLRPFLSVSQSDVLNYAKEQKLHWCEDPSNKDDNFDRNYLRNQVLPSLRERWPSVAKTISRSAKHCASAEQLLNELALQDCPALIDDDGLSIDSLKGLSQHRMKNVLRAWLDQLLQQLPSEKVLQQVIDDVIAAGESAEPQINIGTKLVRRFNNSLYVTDKYLAMATDVQLTWDLTQNLQLPNRLGELVATAGTGKGLRTDLDSVTVRFRRGGERCRLPGQNNSQSLKKLFQEWGVPPWMRDRTPLLYVGDTLAVIAGYAVCEGFLVSDNGLRILLRAKKTPQ